MCAALGACGYRSSPSEPITPVVASVTVSAPGNNPSVGVGHSIQLTATPRDSRGDPITGLAVSWSSSDQTAATVDQSGLVTGMTAGSMPKISALIEGATGSLTVAVTP
jgi:uncharacterized protein YjdB